MKKRIILIVIAVLAVGGMLALTWKVGKEEKQRQKLDAQWEEERLPHKVKRQELKEELESLETTYEADKQPKACVQFIFTELKSDIYSSCYPLMKDMGFSGVLLLSNQYLPGMDGCITLEQFRELQTAGWDVGVKWDATKPIDEWWPELQKSIADLHVQVKSVYMPAGSYKSEMDESLKQMGFNAVIIGKVGDESPLQHNYEKDLWHLASIGFMTSQPKVWLERAVSENANIGYAIGFTNNDELYNVRHFDAMLRACKSYVESEDLIVGDIVDAQSHFTLRAEGPSPEKAAEYNTKKEELLKLIEEVELKLKEIDKRYR